MIDKYALAVLALHLTYALSVYAATFRWPGSVAAWTTATIVIDTLFGVAVAVVTEGATSPAYVFFVFAILEVAFRAGFGATLEVTCACVVLYMAVILMSADRSEHFYLMRPVYLAITGYLIAYLAQQRIDSDNRAHAAETRAERHSIARALHDGYVQALAAVNLRLENCRKLLVRGREEDVLKELADLQTGIRHEYDDVRAYVRSLADLERRELAPIPGDTQVHVSAQFVGSGLLVEHALQIMLEGVRNVRRHADATSTTIGARLAHGRVEISIDDDGVGFAADSPVPWTIASRAKDCGGGARLLRTAARGAHLLVELPDH
jgi:signal transduction histidine kinase